MFYKLHAISAVTSSPSHTPSPSSRKVCVIGERTKKELFKENEDPIGKFISINNVYFKVIGILDSDHTHMKKCKKKYFRPPLSFTSEKHIFKNTIY